MAKHRKHRNFIAKSLPSAKDTARLREELENAISKLLSANVACAIVKNQMFDFTIDQDHERLFIEVKGMNPEERKSFVRFLTHEADDNVISIKERQRRLAHFGDIARRAYSHHFSKDIDDEVLFSNVAALSGTRVRPLAKEK